MASFTGGLLVGLSISLILATAAAAFAYRRFLRLQQRTRQAERLAELGTLTGGLAHEIKNPLSTVQLNLQLLLEDLDPHNPAYSRLVNRINTVKQEAGRLRDILDDFLRYAGRIELNAQPTDLNAMLEELVDFFMPQAQHNRVQLRLRRLEQALFVPVDPKLLKQAVLNLMINAVQAMPDGGELILSLETSGESVAIRVIDTGRGIPAEQASRIFQAYYSTRKGGTGLGLPMARRIAQEHGGELTVQSEPGKGSAFTLRLPR